MLEAAGYLILFVTIMALNSYHRRFSWTQFQAE